MSDERMFPVIPARKVEPHPLRIPWSVAELAYSVYAAKYGRQQSMETLAERGGFHADEMDVLLPDWRDRCSEIRTLREQLAAAEAREKYLERQCDTYLGERQCIGAAIPAELLKEDLTLAENVAFIVSKLPKENPVNDKEPAVCGICGLPMPPGEEMFNYHGYSGPCPGPLLEQPKAEDKDVNIADRATQVTDLGVELIFERNARTEADFEIQSLREQLAASDAITADARDAARYFWEVIHGELSEQRARELASIYPWVDYEEANGVRGALTDFAVAVSRLTAWIRDYGDTKPREFIGDVKLVLMVAKGCDETQRKLAAAVAAHKESVADGLALVDRLGAAQTEVEHWKTVAASLQDILDGETKPIEDVIKSMPSGEYRQGATGEPVCTRDAGQPLPPLEYENTLRLFSTKGLPCHICGNPITTTKKWVTSLVCDECRRKAKEDDHGTSGTDKPDRDRGQTTDGPDRGERGGGDPH